MSAASSTPTSSRLPSGAEPSSPASQPPSDDDTFPLPRLTVHLQDLCHPGTARVSEFFRTHPPAEFLKAAITSVCTHLYLSPTSTPAPPNVQNLALHIRPLPGVAYTTGNHREKEIHLSSNYIASLPESRIADEITGVIRHEMVHVYQHNGCGSAPGGLIEGIADWVRMKDELGPPHWKRGGAKWDDGYQNTAYFLSWVEEKVDETKGFVVRLNAKLGEGEWREALWKELTGVTVLDLWAMYCAEFGIENGVMKGNPAPRPRTEVNGQKEVKETNGTDHERAPTKSVSTRGLGSVGDLAASALAEVCRKRLCDLQFTGRTNGQRFMREFDALLDKALPNAGPEAKRLLLVTSLHDEAGDWYEEIDLDDNMSYEVLKQAVAKSFPGKSKRTHKLIEREAISDQY